jgi:hypothetical protein
VEQNEWFDKMKQLTDELHKLSHEAPQPASQESRRLARVRLMEVAGAACDVLSYITAPRRGTPGSFRLRQVLHQRRNQTGVDVASEVAPRTYPQKLDKRVRLRKCNDRLRLPTASGRAEIVFTCQHEKHARGAARAPRLRSDGKSDVQGVHPDLVRPGRSRLLPRGSRNARPTGKQERERGN